MLNFDTFAARVFLYGAMMMLALFACAVVA